MQVLVVGAGVLGCAVSWVLARAGCRVTVLERAIPGAEASSAAGGILAPWTESGGCAGPVLTAGLASLERYPAWVESLREVTGIDVAFRRCGVIHTALDEAGVADHDTMASQLPGAVFERLTADESRHRWPWLGPTVRDALWLPTEATLDNRLLVGAVHAAARAAGAEFVTGHTALELELDGSRAVGVRTDRGVLRASQVVICAGAWTSCLGRLASSLHIRPIRGQMLVVRAPAPPVPSVVFAARRGYLVPRLDGRVLIGSTMEEVGFDKAVTINGLRHLTSLAADLAPGLAPLPVVEQWAGFRPATSDDLPAIGPLGPDGAWVASGHLRNGILLAPITAEILAAQILGQSPPVDAQAFDPRRFTRGS